MGRDALSRKLIKERDSYGHGQFVLLVVRNHIALGCLDTESEIDIIVALGILRGQHWKNGFIGSKQG